MLASKYADTPAERPDSSRQDWSPANTPVKESRPSLFSSRYADAPSSDMKTSAPLAQQDTVQTGSQPSQSTLPSRSSPPPPVTGLLASKYAEPALIDVAVPANEVSSTEKTSKPVTEGKLEKLQDVVQIPPTTDIASAPVELSTMNGLSNESKPQTTNGPEHVGVPSKSSLVTPQPINGPELAFNALDVAVKSPPPIENASTVLSAVPDRIATPSGIQRTDSRASNSSTGKIRKLSKKGKPCVIRMPKDTSKSFSGFPVPMSTEAFLRRLEDFERQGYDTRGYDYWNLGPDSVYEDIGAQNRIDYPSFQDQKEDAAQQQNTPKVSIPNKQEWDDYENYLREEKLKALGVDIPPEPASEPEMETLQQIASPFPTNALSPPIPTSSAASLKMLQNILPFSAPFSPVSTNNTSIAGITSPSGNQSVSEALSRQQSGHGFVFPPPQGNYQPAWSPQGMFNHQIISRGGTPAGPIQPLQRQASTLSQARDSFIEAQSTPRVGFSELNQSERSSQHNFQGPDTQENHSQLDGYGNLEGSFADNRASTPDNKNVQSQSLDSYGNLQYPTPRGHRHNISANLEREVEAAQYYPGEYVHEAETDNQQNSNTHGKLFAAGPQENKFDALPELKKWQPGHSAMPSVASNASSSRLNGEAKEFKYDPTKPHSKKWSVSKTTFMPDAAQPARIDPLHPFLSLTNATAHKGFKSSSGLNVEAPSFQPPMAHATFSMPTSDFNFFQPRPKEAESRMGSEQPEEKSAEQTPDGGSKIFSQINLAEIVKPPRLSKAIPIVNPADLNDEHSSSEEDDEPEDADGRIIQSDARRKRGRRNADDGDEVPRFASPTPTVSTAKATTPAPINGHDFASPAMPSTSSDQTRLDSLEKTDEKEQLVDVNARPGSADLPWHGIEDESHETLLRPALVINGDRTISRSPPLSRNTSSHNDERPIDNDTLDDINAVMDQLNDNSDFGIEHASPTRDHAPLSSTPREAAPSQQKPANAAAEEHEKKLSQINATELGDRTSLRNERLSSSHLQDGANNRVEHSPVRNLNKFDDAPISDWDDMLESGEELIIPSQHTSQFLDSSMVTLVEGLLRRHLEPFERQFKDMGDAVKTISARAASRNANRAPRPLSAYDKSDSDADDEDEEEPDLEAQRRPRGGKSDRSVERIKAAVVDAMTTAQSNGLGLIEQEAKFRKAAESRAEDVQRLLTLAEKEIELFKEQSDQYDEKIKVLEEEKKKDRRRNAAVEEELRTKTLHFTAEVATLENNLDEYRSSSAKWKDEIDSVKRSRENLSRTIENLRKEAIEHNRTRDALDQKLKRMEEEMSSVANNFASERTIWQQKDEDLSKRFEVLQVRYQEEARIRSKLEKETTELREQERDAIKTAVTLEETQTAKARLEESITRLNEEVLREQRIAGQYERVMIEAKEKTTTEVQRTRTLLEAEIEVANKKTENVRAEFETRLGIVRAELDNARHEVEMNKRRHETLAEENARYQKKLMRDTNERHLATLEEEREKFEFSLKELSEQHERTFREHAESSRKSLEEEREKSKANTLEMNSGYERRLAEANKSWSNRLEDELSRSQRTIDDMKAYHERAFNNATEDKRRSEAHHQESLNLSNSRVQHLLEKITYLEDKVSVAQSAAQAAIQSAKVAKSAAPLAPAANATVPTKRTEQFEKVSPQALRESIVVLQEQLQERESRIESLEQELSQVDKDAPTKLGDRDSEIAWLRELLGVRVDDLSELINTLSQPDFDRLSARDAAIRIRANLQMEEQERERYSSSGKPAALDLSSLRRNSPGAGLPSLTDIQNFASPKAAQLAAAWGNWRKGKDGSGGQSLQALREAVNAGTPSTRRTATANSSGRRQSAGKSNANGGNSGFLSGLMTPPASNLRRATPTPSSVSSTTVMPPTSHRPLTPRRSSSSSSRPGTQGSPTAARKNRSPTSMRTTSLQLQRQQSWGQQSSSSSHRRNSSSSNARATSSRLEALPGPPLLSSGGYDMDAEDHDGVYEVDEDEDESEQAVSRGKEAEQVIEDTKLLPLGEELASAFPANSGDDEVIEEEPEEDEEAENDAGEHYRGTEEVAA